MKSKVLILREKHLAISITILVIGIITRYAPLCFFGCVAVPIHLARLNKSRKAVKAEKGENE